MIRTAIDNFLKQQPKTPSDQPLFRLIWSEDALEMRYGTFREFAGELFIRETIGVKEVSKYPWIENRWVLEMWVPPDISFSKELPASTNGTYEPVYVFEDKNGNSLPLNLRVVEIIVYYTLRKTPPEKLNDSAALEREAAYFEDKMDLRENLTDHSIGYGIDRRYDRVHDK